MYKFLLLIFVFLLGVSCTQQHLILAENINRADFISVDQILEESGLKKSLPDKTITKKTVKPIKKIKAPVKKKYTVKSKTVKLKIPRMEEFSINLDSHNLFIVLKSLSGDLHYLSTKSNPDKGFFLFKMGNNNSMVRLEVYDLSGIHRKTINYQIHPLKALKNNTSTNSNQILVLDNTKKGKDNLITLEADTAQNILASLEGKSIREKIKILKNSIKDPEIKSNAKQVLNIELIKLYIEDYSFSKAKENIQNIQDNIWKNYLKGLYAHKRKQYSLAMQYYIKTLNNNPEFKDEFLPHIIDLISKVGTVKLNVITRIEDLNKALEETEPDSYALNQIGIARIYVLNSEIIAAEKILNNIIEGNYSFSIIRTAEDSLKELEEEFLDYR